MEQSHLYVLIGIALVIAELFVGSFFLLPIGLGFFLTGLMAAAFDFGSAIYAVAIVNLLWIFVATRVWLARRRKRSGPPLRSGADALIGQLAKVEEEINALAGTGYVRVYGDSWRAKPVHREGNPDVFAPGEWVEIVAVDGNHVRVRRKSS